MSQLHVERFGPGHEIAATNPGDFILTHRNSPYSKLVTFGQNLRFRGDRRPYAHWSHTAFVVDGQGGLVEALGRGIVRNNLSEYKDTEYHYVHTEMSIEDRAQAVRFVEMCVGERYGWLTIIGLGITTVTPSKITIGVNGTEICSGLVARGLERGWYVFRVAPNGIMPGDLAEQFDIRPLPSGSKL